MAEQQARPTRLSPRPASGQEEKTHAAKNRWTIWTWSPLVRRPSPGFGVRHQHLSRRRAASSSTRDARPLRRALRRATSTVTATPTSRSVSPAPDDGDVDAGRARPLRLGERFRTDNDDVLDGDSSGIAGDAEPDDRFGRAGGGRLRRRRLRRPGDRRSGRGDRQRLPTPAPWILYGTAGGLTTSGSDDFNQDSTGVPTGAHATKSSAPRSPPGISTTTATTISR